MSDDLDRGLRAVTLVFAVAFVAGFFILHFYKFPLDPSILDTQARLLKLESTRAQSLYYVTLLGLFAAFTLLVLLRPNSKIIPATGRSGHWLSIALVAAAIFFGSWSWQFLLGFSLIAALIIFSRSRWACAIWVCLTRTGMARKLPLSGIIFWLLIGVVFVYAVIFLVLPLAVPLLIPRAAEFPRIEGHYAVSVLPGFDLICCSELGVIERANYGLGVPLLTALALKTLAILGQPETALVPAVKLNQLIAALLICILSFLANRKYFSLVMALALGMTAFTLSNVGISVSYPNQSGIRYIPLLAALIVLVLELRRARMRIWLLAITSAIFVIMSPETGLAATAGYIVAAVLTRYDLRKPAASIAATIAQYAAVFSVTMIVASALVVGPILKNSSEGLFQFVVLFATASYGGLVDKPSLMASLLFFTAATAVLRAAYCARGGILQSVDAHEAAFGTVMLVWLMYYVNRMAEWNLWFQPVLLALLIAPRLTIKGWHQPAGKPSRFGVTIPMIVACLIGGQLASSSYQFAGQAVGWLKWQHQGCGEGIILDGKCLSWLRGSRFELQMNALTENHAPDQTLVLSGLSTFARLRGFNDGFPWYDPMEVVRKQEVEEIVNWIETRGPKYIVADDPAYDVARSVPEHSRQIHSYLARLVSYREVSRSGGWVILERVVKLAH